MATYLISYDLISPGKNYQGLIDRLHADGAVSVLLSAWVCRYNGAADAVRDHLRPFMDSNDRLFVTDVNNWAGYNMLNVERAKQVLPA